MTTALMTLALAVPALVFAVWPALARRSGQAGPVTAPADDERAGLENEKVIALRALRELELDRVAGHVDDEDYRDLHARYEGDAVAALRRLDALGPAARRPAARFLTGAGRRDTLDPAARRPRRDGSRAPRVRGRPGPPRLPLLDAGAPGARHDHRPARGALPP